MVYISNKLEQKNITNEKKIYTSFLNSLKFQKLIIIVNII